ncbi:MAG: GcrA family cell cycle regulator [Beijerinckiaceae bacterium]
MSWTNERIELLQKLWLEGWSASRIAGELGCGITRNAVIGKVYRLGLSGRDNARSENVPASPPHQKAVRRLGHQHACSPQVAGNPALAFDPFVIEAPTPHTVREVVVVTISEPVTIAELRESMCRWPIGDPAQSEFRFCGAKKLPGQGPYCACHAGIAYQTQHDRRRERRPQGELSGPLLRG